RYTPFATRARELLAVGRFGPLSHIYVRLNRPGPARYQTWDCAWMLDPAEAGGGCLRNLGPHGLDMFLHLTGEETQATGAHLSGGAHEGPVEDYASVMLRSASGVLGPVEVGNGFPRDGTDGEWKIAGRDAILTMKDGIMKLATAESDETLPGATVTAPAFTALRDALDHWRRGAAPPISVHDCARVVRLIDQAYERAGRPSTSRAGYGMAQPSGGGDGRLPRNRPGDAVTACRHGHSSFDCMYFQRGRITIRKGISPGSRERIVATARSIARRPYAADRNLWIGVHHIPD